MKQHKDCNFSYAGLKTQVRLAIEAKNMYAVRMRKAKATCLHSLNIYCLVLESPCSHNFRLFAELILTNR